MTFGAYSTRWLEEATVRRSWKPRTVTAYTQALQHLEPYFGSMRLASVRPRDVASYTKEAMGKYSPATVELDLSVLHSIFKTALREQLVDSNPAVGAEHPKAVPYRPRILQPHEVKKVLASFPNQRARTIFLVLTLTGMRRKELTGLRWGHVDLVARVLRIEESKTDEGIRSVAMSPMVCEALIDHLGRSNFTGDAELVFGHPEKGTPLDPKVYAADFRKALKAAGITDYVRPFHDARHGSLTNGAAQGESPIELMTRAGHKSMSTTKRYLHLAGTTFPDAVAALEARMLGDGGRKFYPSEATSPDLAAPKTAETSGFDPRST